MVLSLSSVRRIDEIVAGTQAAGRAPSIIAAIVREGGVAHVTTAGEVPTPDRDTHYRLGSITKSLTAAVLLLLRDEGRLDLDDRLATHLDDLDPAVGALRLRQVLGHAAGLQREPDGAWWERHPGGSLDALVAGTTAAKLAFRPHERLHYSNLAYGLLGGVVARVTGQGWFDAVRTRLLEPLGMTRTTYEPTEPFARGYVIDPVHHTLREEPREDHGAMAAAGQLWSTIADLATWAGELTGAGHVLPAARAAEMATPVALADPDTWTYGYGLGLQLWRSGDRVIVGHTGSMPGYLSVVAVHRPSRTAALAFANCYTLPGAGIGGLGVALVDAVLDHEPVLTRPWRPPAPPPAELASLGGRWWWMGREYEVHFDGEQLLMGLVGALPGRFHLEQPDRWRCHDGEEVGEILTVLRDDSGAAIGLDVATFLYRRAPMAD